MIAGNQCGEANFVGGPSQGRSKFADEAGGRLVVTQLGSGAANIVHQGRGLQNLAVGFALGAAGNSIQCEAVVELQREISNVAGVDYAGVVESRPKLKALHGERAELLGARKSRSPGCPERVTAYGLFTVCVQALLAFLHDA